MAALLRAHRRLSAIMAICLAASASAAVPSADDVLNAAFAQAKAEHKNVLVHFGASWCVWCKHLDAMLESPEVGGIFHDNYVIAHLTILESDDKKALENPGAEAVVERSIGKIDGVPFYMFYDDDGHRLATSLAMPDGSNIGHPVAPEEITAFLGLLEKTAPHMTPADRDKVAAYLSKQKH